MNTQTELPFEKVTQANKYRPQRRLSRANWWFQQMRAVVDKAVDWRPAPPNSNHQTKLPL